MNGVLLGITFLSQFLLLGIFVWRLKFVKIATIEHIGVYYAVELLLPMMGLAAAMLLKLSTNETVFLFDNIVLFFAFSLFLITYSKQKIVADLFIWVAFVILSTVWIGEFGIGFFKNGIVGMQRLHITPVFFCGVAITGVLVYWLKIFKVNQIFYLQNPFFWVSLGWFIYFVLDLPTHFPSIAKRPFFEKLFLFGYLSFYNIMAHLCFMVAFWKSKKWVSKGYNRKL